MKITDIKKQVKRSDRFSIFVEERYAFSLSELELLRSGLNIGKEIDDNQLNSLKDTAVEDKAYDLALNLIMRRPRSEWELREYLKRKSTNTELVDKILNRLSEAGYVNDFDFACRWIENRRLLKSTSKRKLQLELRQKRVSDEIIQQAMSQDQGDERDILRELIEKKRTQSRYQDDQKLIAYLARQGFKYDDIKSVMSK